jgi:phosphohistidine phosphatase SixA
MPTHLIFLRHGHYPRSGRTRSERNQEPLSALGFKQAKSAAEWLHHAGLSVDLIVHTRSARAQQTASAVAVRFPNAPLLPVSSGFRNIQGLEKKLAQWCFKNSPACVVFVGHDSSQSCLVSHFGLAAKKADRTVIVLAADPTSIGFEWRFHSGSVNADSENTHDLIPLLQSN